MNGLFMPHGHCYLWDPGLLWLQVISNALIGASYVAIAITLGYLVGRIQDIPFRTMYLAFGIFIISCGITHFFDVWVIWNPDYWLDGSVRAVTAVASVGTAVALPPLVPRALTLARGAQAAHERGVRLENMVDDLATMYEKTRELEMVKTQFFANVSHELRTPLALILGPSEKLLKAENLSDEQRRDVEVMRRNAATLLKHVNDLLDVARMESGKVEADHERVDLARLLRQICAHFEAVAADRDIALRVEGPETLSAELDRAKIERVLLNLLSNAFKYTPGGGTIRVALREREGQAQLEVADAGPGIPEADRGRIFERFRQLEGPAERVLGGTGLGLAITRDFVVLHGGTVEVGDAPEGGAAFVVTLPLKAPEGREVRARDDAEMADAGVVAQTIDSLRVRAPETLPPGSDERPLVLVVEDSPDMNRFVAECLRAEFRVETAFDGEEGLGKALEVRPDLVLSDVMMPRMSGDRMVQAMRERPELGSVPIMMLTAKADDELMVKLLKEHAQDYVMKPFAPAELLVRVRNLISMKRARDLLQRELSSHVRDLEALAGEVGSRKRELEQALQTARVARDQAERASQVKTNFMRLVSHELRTPLAVLGLQLEHLKLLGADLTPEQQEVAAKMKKSTTRLTHLIEALLQHARTSAGAIRVRNEPVDLVELAHDVVDEADTTNREQGPTIELELADDIPEVVTDRELLRLVLANLVGNALKFTRDGSVSLKVALFGEQVRLDVTDTGPGIPLGARTRIFEPFEQLEETRQKHAPGVGLGLALVHDLVEVLGARLTLDSQVGKGSTFSVILPLRTSQDADQASN